MNGGMAAEMGPMFHDFEFDDDGRRVVCMRGVRDPSAGHLAGDRWWYLCVASGSPVRLLRVTPGETRQDVWESALSHLDAQEAHRTSGPAPRPRVLETAPG